jgi:hypothetical protein
MSLKTIKVNPSFLGPGSKNLKLSKTRKVKPVGPLSMDTNNVRNKLMKRIKSFQSENVNANINVETDTNAPIINNTFDTAFEFLNNLERVNNTKKKHNSTKKQKHERRPNTHMDIATELPPELDWNIIAPVESVLPVYDVSACDPVASVPVASVPVTCAPRVIPYVTWNAQSLPSYSNLKGGGTKPTYRNWLRGTQKNRHITNNKVLEEPEHISNLEQLPPVAVPYAPSIISKRRRITRTSKYKLGKHPEGKISILIKNAQTRRRVQKEQAELKQKGILEIKNYLRSKNLLKTGSEAPNDVLRHLYEQSILAGLIENKSKENLIHNYFNDEK